MLLDKIITLIQLPLPHHLLSRGMYWLTRRRWRWFKNVFIHIFKSLYRVDLGMAEFDRATDYPTFNHFFTRALKPGTRPFDTASAAVICPVDGTVSQAGVIRDDRLVQAKGVDYSLAALLAGDSAWVQQFRNGSFATLYLSPRDYHRIHMPLRGHLLKTIYVPGRLFSVSDRAVRHIPGLFARNERLICLFDTACGPLAVILVGALFVSGIETVWDGPITRGHKLPWPQDYSRHNITLEKGQELGRFNMGSTVILLFAADRVDLDSVLTAAAGTQMGQTIATVRKAGN